MTAITYTIHDYASIEGLNVTFTIGEHTTLKTDMLLDYLPISYALPFYIAELGITIERIEER